MPELDGRSRPWPAVVAGVFAGGVIGAVVAVNVVIFAGPDSGFETGLTELFRHNVAVGILAVGAAVLGPLVGGVTAWRLHRRTTAVTQPGSSPWPNTSFRSRPWMSRRIRFGGE